MRIVGLKEFMTLENILYTQFDEGFEGSCFSIKYSNSGEPKYNDWVMSQFAPREIETPNGCYGEWTDIIEEAKKDSSLSLKMDFNRTMREAMYYSDDDPIFFAVYEKEDIQNMIEALKDLLQESEDG